MLLLFWRGVGAPVAELVGRRVRRRKYHIRYDEKGGALAVDPGAPLDPLLPWPDGRPALERLEAGLARLEARRRVIDERRDEEDALQLILMHL